MTTIGLFDSGVGGLSVLRAVRVELPEAHLLYVADAAHVPYGPRPLEEVRAFSEGIAGFLLAEGAQVIVVACNTASAAALRSLRVLYPAVSFVGMEPAVKPAAEQSRTGVVAVLATQATFQGELFASVVERFAHDVRVIAQVCPGLVEQIEAGELDTQRTEAMLRGWVEPLLAQHIDALVLGCTHYPFVRPLLERISGPGVRIIDPARAVARQAARLAAALAGPDAGDEPAVTDYFTSGSPEALRCSLQHLLGLNAEVRQVVWGKENQLVLESR